jgi:hypothetical protein
MYACLSPPASQMIFIRRTQGRKGETLEMRTLLVLQNCGQFEYPLRDGTKIRMEQISSLEINRAVRDIVEMLSKTLDTQVRNERRCESLLYPCQYFG